MSHDSSQNHDSIRQSLPDGTFRDATPVRVTANYKSRTSPFSKDKSLPGKSSRSGGQSNPQITELDRLIDLLSELKATDSISNQLKPQPKTLDLNKNKFDLNASHPDENRQKIISPQQQPSIKTSSEQPSSFYTLNPQLSKPINFIPEKPNFDEIYNSNLPGVNSQTFSVENHVSTNSNPNSGSDRVSEQGIVSEKTAIKQSIVKLEQQLSSNQSELKEVAESVNSLLPLISELLRLQLKNSQEFVLEELIPIIDHVIKQKSLKDPHSMAEAIAEILPSAISHKIKIDPQTIAKAIAPEVAHSITEQIRIDRNSISKALGSEMGKAIKSQIELEKDAMVDALYPVIGSTISKYMVEVIKSINEKVENTLSIEGVKRKVRARFRGVSEAELILSEAVDCSIEAIFLIHKASGLIIREIQPNLNYHLEADLVAGMLTAIRSFASDCMASDSELDLINYGNFQIAIEVAGYCYLAIVIKGDPSKQYREKIRHTLSSIVLQCSDEIREYNGDPKSIPDSVDIWLQQLIEVNEQSKKSQSPKTLLWLLAILLSGIFIPWGIIHHRSEVASRLEQQTEIALDSAPELSVYRLTPTIAKGKLTLVGRVPSDRLRTQADAIALKIAQANNLQLDNQIVAVQIPSDPSLTAQEVERVTALINQLPEIAISSNYQGTKVTVAGFVLNQSQLNLISMAFQQIPGVDTVVINTSKELPRIDSTIYFESGITQLNTSSYSKIENVKSFLEQYPQLNLRLTGYSDRSGSTSKNQQFSEERANSVKTALVARGIDSQRLEVSVSLEYPPQVSEDDPIWLSRCVQFEPFIAKKSNH